MVKAVNDELRFVDKSVYKLPQIPSFSCSTEGAVATFIRKFGKEEIAVKMDANSGVDVDTMGSYNAEDSDEEMEVRL